MRISPLAWSMAAHIQSICMAGMNSDTRRKYREASPQISSPPPSQRGSGPETAAPARAMATEKSRAQRSPCRRTSRAPAKSFAPMRWATWTEKPLVAAMQKPPSSHMQVETRPIAAPAAAPRWPTMAVSMYCISTEESCAIMAG